MTPNHTKQVNHSDINSLWIICQPMILPKTPWSLLYYDTVSFAINHNEANKVKILAHSFTSDLLLFWSSVDPGLRDGMRGSDIVIWGKFMNLRGSKFAIFVFWKFTFCHNEANKLKIFTRSFYNWFVAFLIKCGSSNSRWKERGSSENLQF